MKKLNALFIVLLIYVSNAYCQTPVITMTSNFPNGSSFSFALQGAQNTIIQLDFGDGKLLNDTLGSGWTNVNGIKVAQIIKIYGVGITAFLCTSRNLTSIDISNYPTLTYFDCSGNDLTALDVSKNLALGTIRCDNNKLINLDVTKNLGLTILSCPNNQLITLDLSNNIALTILDCYYNQFVILDVHKNTLLHSFNCFQNKLLKLDISKNTLIQTLNCSFNNITLLDVSNCSNLNQINCSNNQISSIILNTISVAHSLDCSNNALTFSSLPIPNGLFTIIYAPQKPIVIDKTIGTGYEVNLSSQLIINGNTTLYTWKTKSGNILVKDIDYTITNGRTIFIKPQTDSVYCALANASFPVSSNNLPWNILTTCTKVILYSGPTISSFIPTSGSTGTIITITGQNLTGTTSVNFGGTPVASFKVNSASSITATVGNGTSGSVSLTNSNGKTSLPGFTYKLNQTITFGAISAQTYGNEDFAPVATNYGGLPITYSSSNTDVASIATGKIHIAAAGTCTIFANQAGDSIHNAASSVSQNLTIKAKDLTITVNSGQSKKIGSNDPELTYSIANNNLVNGETLTGKLTRIPGESAGVYPIQLGNLTAGNNYNITFITNNFTIFSSTAISAIKSEIPAIFPNPTKDNITVDDSDGLVVLMDINGKILLQHNLDVGKTIKLSNYSTGMYFMILKTKNSTYKYKIVRE